MTFPASFVAASLSNRKVCIASAMTGKWEGYFSANICNPSITVRTRHHFSTLYFLLGVLILEKWRAGDSTSALTRKLMR